MDALNKYVRTIKVGTAMYQLCSIIAAREFDEPYEWNSHEGGARRAGVSEKTIEAVKFDRPLDGLPAKEALVVEFGRALFRGQHRVSSELYARVVKEFGQEGMYRADLGHGGLRDGGDHAARGGSTGAESGAVGAAGVLKR